MSDTILDLKIKKQMESYFHCIDKLKKDNETMKFNIQSLNKRVQELEKEVEILKIFQKRRYKKTVQDLLKTLHPIQKWKEYMQEWQKQINQESLEQVFAASTFLESFLKELKKIQPTLLTIHDTIQIPENILPILCVQNENKSHIYIWENDCWNIVQYNHLRKLVSLYIYQIRECWIQWQENNKNDEKYNNYISKPVSILYNESYKTRMIQALNFPKN